MPKQHKAAEPRLFYWLKMLGAVSAAVVATGGLVGLIMTVGGYFSKVTNHEAAITLMLPRVDALERASPIHDLDKRVYAVEAVLKLNSNSTPVIAPLTVRPMAGKQR